VNLPRLRGPHIPFGAQEVKRTPEVRRIAALPRRVWSDEAAAELARVLTLELKTPKGTMTLRPVQAIALYEVMEMGGLFGPMRVGAGKTLFTLLSALVLEAARPVLLLPKSLLEKTRDDRKTLVEHWRLPTNLQFLSYEMLGLVQNADRLNYIRPDLIIADECHFLKNPRAGRTRRVKRYMHDHPETKFVGVSGTVMKASIKDFAPLLRWALKDRTPVPATEDEVGSWADALDEKVNPLARRRPDALLDLGPRVPANDKLSSARRVFQARLLETKGVVASSRTDGVTCSLRVSALEYKPSVITETHVGNLRRTWRTPDGWSFSQALELRRHIRSLALGFHAIWDPRPPAEWLLARRAWASFARETLSNSRTIDTELQVANSVDAGDVDDSEETLAGWRAVRDTFTIQPKPVWHDDTALTACATWMEREKGIVWCEHVFFAKRLSEITGSAYYGAEGRNANGQSIMHVKPGRAIIASIDACRQGFNLQDRYSKNLITSCPPGPATNEQLIGRTHRDGQEADEVVVDILLGCGAHHESFTRAMDGARAAADTLGHDQKLLLATVAMPSIVGRRGPLWT